MDSCHYSYFTDGETDSERSDDVLRVPQGTRGCRVPAQHSPSPHHIVLLHSLGKLPKRTKSPSKKHRQPFIFSWTWLAILMECSLFFTEMASISICIYILNCLLICSFSWFPLGPAKALLTISLYPGFNHYTPLLGIHNATAFCKSLEEESASATHTHLLSSTTCKWLMHRVFGRAHPPLRRLADTLN